VRWHRCIVGGPARVDSCVAPVVALGR
jgi:hypothetical protein